MAVWNPWHGCIKYSEGCDNCYVYRMDKKYERDSSKVTINKSFSLPVQKYKNGEYKIKSGDILYTCFSSDFFLDDADVWRTKAWEMMRERRDINFLIITKRILRFMDCIPPDWGDGYGNVIIFCTVENQKRADERLPVFSKLPIKHKGIVCSPLLGPIDLGDYLCGIEQVTVAGESGYNARVCDYNWILSIREQCMEQCVDFKFSQTGAKLRKDGKLYYIKRKYQHSQAGKANINYQKLI
ncbi:MAG: phage Gp37/Gp68 family protein [Oscillospiraceae bacterium]|nr:phage Gp37/Gp68 family protein [Oscillospiraceae bacterium]